MTTNELQTAGTIKRHGRIWFARNGVAIAGFAAIRTPSYTCVSHGAKTLTAVPNDELYTSEDEARSAADQQEIIYKVCVKNDW